MKLSLLSSLISIQGELAAQVRESEVVAYNPTARDTFKAKPSGSEASDNPTVARVRLQVVSEAVDAALMRPPFLSPGTSATRLLLHQLARVHREISEEAGEIDVLSRSTSWVDVGTVIMWLGHTQEQLARVAIEIAESRPAQSAIANELADTHGKINEVTCALLPLILTGAPPSKNVANLARAQLPVLLKAVDTLLSHVEAASPLVAGANAAS